MARADLTHYGLTARETQAVACIARGLELKEIAREMGVGYQTAKMYARHAKRKMDARNLLEVAILAHGGVPASHEATPPIGDAPIEHAPTWASHLRHALRR